MKLKVLYFASLREAFGCAEETVDLPAGVDTTGALRDWLAQQGRERLGTVRNLRCAVNQELTDLQSAITEGDEVAFFPPVTGG